MSERPSGVITAAVVFRYSAITAATSFSGTWYACNTSGIALRNTESNAFLDSRFFQDATECKDLRYSASSRPKTILLRAKEGVQHRL